MTAKKDYTSMLRILCESSTAQASYNKLTALAIETDDEQLKSLAITISGYIRPAPGAKPGSKFIIAASAARKGSPANLTPPQKARAEKIALAINYCNHVINSNEPVWVAHARAAGWTPPSPPEQNT